jgi:DNA-binding MarR family transcriptional regulator
MAPTPSQTTPSNVQQLAPAELASRLRLSVMRLSRRLRQHAPGDVTQSQLSALAVLVNQGPLTLRELAEAERVQPPTVTRIVDRLTERGLVARRADTNDRRVSWVEATADGRKLVEHVRRRRDSYLAERLRTFDADERALLARASELLERLYEDPAR